MKNYSIWNEFLNKNNNYSKLKNDIETDVLIIGGGIAGILTAFNLSKTSLKVTLVERNKLLSGITSKMTAKVTILQDILTKIDDDKVNLYLKSQIEGMKLLKDNIDKLNINCDFLESNGYLYTSRKSNIKKLKKIENELNQLKINYSNDLLNIDELNNLYNIKTNAYVINPIKYLNSLIDNLNINIYEQTNIIKVSKVKKYYIGYTSDNIKITSKYVIFATNYPYFLKPLLFPIKVRIEKSNIIYGNSKYIGNYNVINIDKSIKSIRFYNDKMIYLTNNKYISHSNNLKDFQKIEKSNLVSRIDNIWSNMDIVTNDYLPLVGKLFNNMYIITGFNTWGILSSHIGASLISSLIIKKKNYSKYQKLFNPKRIVTFKKMLNSSINILENMNGYFKGMITHNKVVYYNKDRAIYIDSKGKYYSVKRICPHMKCKLIFNEIEHTWDCPCHGSRFDLEGNIISGPSKYNVK